MKGDFATLDFHLDRLLLAIHLVAMALFLGGIASGAAIDTAINGGPLTLLADGRRLVALLGHVLIVPGLAGFVVSGLLLALLRFGLGWPRWALAEAGLLVAVAAVTVLLVTPALDMATEWAIRSAADGLRHADYDRWFGRENDCGGVNLMLFAIAAMMALWQPRLGGKDGGR